MVKKLIVGLLLLGLFVMPAMAKTTIEYWYSSMGVEMMQPFLDMAAQEFPDIEVKAEFVSGGNMADKVLLAAASGNPPNVIMGYEGRNVAYFYYGLLESLQDSLTQADRDDFLPGQLDLYTIDGDLFSYPTYQVVITFMANKTLLDEAGVWSMIPADRELEFDNLMAIAEKVNRPPDTYAFNFFAQGKGGDYYMLQWFQAFGANEYENADYSKTTLNSVAGVKALTWMVEMANAGFCPPGPAGLSSRDHFQNYAQGRTIFFGGTPPTANPEAWEGYVAEGSANRLYEVRVMQTPHVKGVPIPGLFPSATTTVVFKEDNAEVRNASIAFAKYLVSTEGLEYLAGITKNIPARKSVVAEVLKLPYFKFTMDLLSKVGLADLGVNSPNYLEVRLARAPELQAAFLGSKTPQQALDDFAASIARLWEDR